MAEDTLDEAFAARMLLGLVEAANVEGKPVSRREIGRRASVLLELGKPIPDRTIGRYFEGRIPERLRIIWALARVMHVHPGWLAFGDEGGAPAPQSARIDGFKRLDPPA